jgi:hypothetical protein
MKYLKTFWQINELKSLDSYNPVTYVLNRVMSALKRLTELKIDEEGRALSGMPTETQLIKTTTNAIVSSILEFYELEDNKTNRKKINSTFHIYYNIVQNLQLHIKNAKKDFMTIYFGRNNRIDDLALEQTLEMLIKEIESKNPEWKEGAEFKKTEILPFKKTKFITDYDNIQIYDWLTTFETLEKLFLNFLFENLDDTQFEKYKDIIDRNIDKLKQYVEDKDYRAYIAYDKMFPNIMISPLDQNRIYDKKYLSNYIETIHDIGIDKNLFDKKFVEFLNIFIKFIKNK